MDRARVAIVVTKIISEQLGRTEDVIKEETTLNDLGADSLDLVELVMGLDDEFHIHIPDGKIDGNTKVSYIIDYCKELIG